MDATIARVGTVLSRRQMQIFFLLRNGPLTVGEIAAALFDGEPLGGPDWADGIVTTAVARMRKKIDQHKLPIRIWTNPGGGGYSLEVAA